MSNHSSVTEFCLLGFPGSQELHHILFAIFFLFYSVTIMGNTIIIVIICVDKHLHSPMYFFLGHLSAVEMLTTSTIVPMMLWGLLLPGMQTVSLTACVAQLFLYLCSGDHRVCTAGSDGCGPLRGCLLPFEVQYHYEQPHLHLSGDWVMGVWVPFRNLASLCHISVYLLQIKRLRPFLL